MIIMYNAEAYQMEGDNYLFGWPFVCQFGHHSATKRFDCIELSALFFFLLHNYTILLHRAVAAATVHNVQLNVFASPNHSNDNDNACDS